MVKLSKSTSHDSWDQKPSSSQTKPNKVVKSKVSQRDLRKRWTPCAQLLTSSRSLPHKTDTTQSGPVDPPSAHSPPSRPSGSPRMSTKRLVSKSSTPNVSEQW